MKTWLIIAVYCYTHNLSSCEIRAWKKIQAWSHDLWSHDLCDTGTVHYQLSYQANRELTTLWVRNIPVDGGEYKWIYQISNIIYLNCRESFEDMIDHRSYIHNLSSCEIKAWKNSDLSEIRTHDPCDTGASFYQLSYQPIVACSFCHCCYLHLQYAFTMADYIVPTIAFCPLYLPFIYLFVIW